ncbi:P-type conjugative transfer protein TrbL [Bradyrhizobium sp. WSM 1738]|uniref:P-type conjugative transfer protein TrbL n=1 Tax=Bradyrhizobium hereditatis TaxID=2821405 RepID=UPI001CE2EFFA|nr:P-type conjugative transfer protein TrbL [Bradyrhizobium hereditatis]MCA6114968.1 P-type conjugative transfer protein TrbL [Bradyrhizobium hereditatis]
MADLSVIDRFTVTFSRYIDSGFGLLSGDVSFLSSTLIAIDLTLAGLAWGLRADDHILVTLAKKVLYIGAFAFIIGNFKSLAEIVFASFSSIGLRASGGTLSAADLTRPGFVASAGFTAAHPLLEETSQFSGLEVLTNLPTILILLFCWIVIVLAFFVLSVQLFVTLIEFKLTTLASFILVPFALWGKTAFLAEKTLGNVVASGVKVMVLAIIIGIGSTIFNQLAGTLTRPVDIVSAMSLLLAALSLFGLGIFGPGIAAGLVSGAPQLGAGAAAGTVAGAAAVAIGGGAAAVGGLRLAAGGSMAAVRSAASLTGASSAGGASLRTVAADQLSNASSGSTKSGPAVSREGRAPTSPGLGHARKAAQVAAHTLKEGDKGGHSSGPKLGEE